MQLIDGKRGPHSLERETQYGNVVYSSAEYSSTEDDSDLGN
jgi:hypothetical protein